MLPKQDVVGSNPITRSTKLGIRLVTPEQAKEIDIGKVYHRSQVHHREKKKLPDELLPMFVNKQGKPEILTGGGNGLCQNAFY